MPSGVTPVEWVKLKGRESDLTVTHARTVVVFDTKLQALVYDTLPPTTAIVGYAIGLEKLCQLTNSFDDSQTAVSFNSQLSLYQTFLLYLTTLFTPAQTKPE